MKKRDCPYCGKKQIDGRHIRMCPKRPQETSSEEKGEQLLPPEVVMPVAEPLQSVEVNPPEVPKPEERMCHLCGKYPVQKLNALDWRCPVCGDYGPRKG